jgi:hypothetical protein
LKVKAINVVYALAMFVNTEEKESAEKVENI